MRAALAIVTAGLAASACSAPGPAPVAGTAPPPPRITYSAAGLERVVGQNATQLVALLGTPDADLTEGTGRKMQFGSGICVLDAYLYPKAGGGVPVVAHVDARQRDGRAIDRASCVAALTRREDGR